MSTLELFEFQPTPEQASAEWVAAALRANLNDYLAGGRASFEAHFPIGIGSDVQDLAHKIFLDSLGCETAGEGFLVLPGGAKLYARELKFPKEEGGAPYHLIYSSEPLPN